MAKTPIGKPKKNTPTIFDHLWIFTYVYICLPFMVSFWGWFRLLGLPHDVSRPWLFCCGKRPPWGESKPTSGGLHSTCLVGGFKPWNFIFHFIWDVIRNPLTKSMILSEGLKPPTRCISLCKHGIHILKFYSTSLY